jgi:hypothetical protein
MHAGNSPKDGLQLSHRIQCSGCATVGGGYLFEFTARICQPRLDYSAFVLLDAVRIEGRGMPG